MSLITFLLAFGIVGNSGWADVRPEYVIFIEHANILNTSNMVLPTEETYEENFDWMDYLDLQNIQSLMQLERKDILSPRMR